MDLRAILNPANDETRATTPAIGELDSQSSATAPPSGATTEVRDDDETMSEVSSQSRTDDAFNTPSKHHRGSSDTVPSTVPSNSRYAEEREILDIVLSPSKGRVYSRRASTSPTRVPVLLSPRKRRRLIDRFQIPPPSLETNINRFSIFLALLVYPELTLEVAKHLEVEDLISLYSISKDFHMLVNSRFTAMITAQWHGKASESGRTFIHRCYKNLCMRDPARRINETRPDELRFVPSFRWLQMILYREAVVDEIMRALLREGHRLPRSATLTIKKIWFTIDISDNTRRIGLMHNVNFWTNKDLFLATMFFLKLDMRLTHPATGNGELGLRNMLLGQRSLSTLTRVLWREEMVTQLDMLRMIVRFNYEPQQHKEMRILGVPPKEMGKLQYEGWGTGDQKFIGIADLVMREAVRRKLNLQNHYVDMMIYGYINKKTWTDIMTAIPVPEEDADADEEDSTDDEKELTKTSFFADESEEDQGSEEEDGKNDENEMDFAKYDLSSKAGTQSQQLGNFKGNPGM